MNEEVRLEDLLRADPADHGCDVVAPLFGPYVEMQLSGHDPADRFPEVTIHLRGCAACREDIEGLIATVKELGSARPDNRTGGDT